LLNGISDITQTATINNTIINTSFVFIYIFECHILFMISVYENPGVFFCIMPKNDLGVWDNSGERDERRNWMILRRNDRRVFRR
jgi:hypothetical protein